MAINVKFDLAGNPEPPTIILAKRNGDKLGQLKVNANSIELADRFNDISEISFTLNKYVDGELTHLWDKVVDFKLVYCKEWDLWFEITVELDEATETVKTVTCTQLGQAELSQIMLYNVEINTEEDIERDDYKIAILYDEKNPKASILHRVLEKAPHYSIKYVDPTIKNIQKSFSFDGTSIYDAFQEIAEEVGCLFVFHSNSDDNGKIQRIISVYDLEQNCNDCGHRGEFTDTCPNPECTGDGKNIKYGYGKDTLIFVTSDELASEGIQLTTDTDSVKNCFKLEAGDDLMTATVRNCNPNGTDYIWRFSDSLKEDMSEELVEKLKSYDELYKDYYNNHKSNLNEDLLNQYNSLVEKYKGYYDTPSSCINCDYKGDFDGECPSCGSENVLTGKSLQTIPTPITGYSALMNAYYNTIDLGLYLKSGLMPNIEMSETSAEEQVKLLTASSLSPVAVNTENAAAISLSTANSAVLSMAKIIVKSTYKVEVGTSTLSEDKVWRGNFVVTNYSDDKDTATSGTITVTVNNDTETFVKQKIEKALNKENTDDYSISGLFEKGYDDFCAELKKYALNPLKSFYDACDACLNILIDQGAGNKNEKPDLYENLYEPYYKKSSAISAEIKIRENEIAIIEGVYDGTDEENPELTTKGLQQYIEECRNEIQDALNFEGYLGTELWSEFCTYRREDKYSNDNYISDGLNNAELFEKALEFIEVAEEEIYKASETQCSISTTLNNLLAIPKFKPLVESFEVGNWIRVQVDDKIYKLRLLEYEIDFGNFENIPVEFSEATKIKNGITDVKDVLSQASSMATSYDAVQRQAKQGNNAKGTIDEWLTKGLNSALVQIQNNDSEEITLGKTGLLGRSYNEITDTYSPEQFKLTHNIMAYTTDNWETVSAALGKHEYTKWQNNQWIKDVDYGLSSTFVTAGYVTGSQIIGGEIVSSNYKSGESGTYFNLIDGDFEIAGGSIVYDTSDKALTLKNVTIEWDSTTKPEVTDITGLSEYLEQLDDLGTQLDNRAETWYQDTDPSVEWMTVETMALHVGDLWHYTGETGNVNGVERIKNSEWIWQEVDGDYQWVAIEISDIVFDAIDSKAQIFTSTPIPPYYIGDLWVQGNTGDIMHCVISKEEGQSYSSDDWVKSSKYTDDTVAKEALEQAQQGIADAAKGISLANDAQTTAEAAASRAEQAESNAKDYADEQDAELSTTLTFAYEKYADSKVYELDTAVANYLGLDGSTLIDENYIISPYIAGGYLNITNIDNNSRVIIDPNNLTGNGYIFQVHNGNKVSVGIDSSGNAEFNGSITATSLTLVQGADVSGLSSVAISGKYDDLTGKPTIPTSLSDLEDDLNVMTTSDISITTSTNSTTGITTTKTKVGGNEYTTYTSKNANYLLTNLGVGKDADANSYFKVDTNGLLKARNALIYGTIYATDGKFSGTISSSVITGSTFKSLNSYKDYVYIADGYIEYGGADGSLVAATMGYNQLGDFGIGTRNNIDLYIGSSGGLYLTASSGLTAGSMRMGSTGNIAFYGSTENAQNNESMLGYIGFNGGTVLNINADGATIKMEETCFYPSANDSLYLGLADYKWKSVYAVTGTIQTSDRNLKKDIVELDDRYIDLFDRLCPVSFGFTDQDSDRTHVGFISQDVKEVMDEVGLSDLDFAGYCRDIKQVEDEDTGNLVPVLDEDGNPEYIYSLRYQEFIALNTKMIQENRKTIQSQAEEIQILKDKISALEDALELVI